MSVAELKEEAIRQFAVKMEAMEDETGLKKVLDFLSTIKGGNDEGLNLSRHHSNISERYSSVLKKLAE